MRPARCGESAAGAGRTGGWAPGRHLLAWALALALAATVAEARPRRFQEKAFKEGYREVLRLWSGDAREEAVAALLDLEAAAVAERGRGVVEPMWRAELRVLRELIHGDCLGALAPAALLHERSYLEYLERRDPVLAVHARTMTAELLEFYADRAEEREERLLVAAMTASLAGRLQNASQYVSAARLYRRALEVDPGSAVAHLGLARVLEKVGDYDGAIEHLRELRQADPGDREGALRLAVNLARVGRDGESVELLEGLIEDGPSDWVTALAHQELVSLLTDRDEDGAARRIVEGGVRRFPGDATLWIQRAFLDDRSGVRSDFDLERELAAAASVEGESPRHVYLQAPPTALDALRRTVYLRSRDGFACAGAALRRGGGREAGG